MDEISKRLRPEMVHQVGAKFRGRLPLVCSGYDHSNMPLGAYRLLSRKSILNTQSGLENMSFVVIEKAVFFVPGTKARGPKEKV